MSLLKPRSSALGLGKGHARAFTLIELMVVVGIMAVVMAMGVPIVYRIWHKEPMRKAVTDVEEVLSNARARAILQGVETEVVFYPKEGRFEVSGGGASPRPADAANAATGQINAAAAPGSGLSGQLSDRVVIQMLDINLMPFSDQDEARVHFRPNGTCDELMLIMKSLDDSEQRGVTLEITTSLASILNEADLQNLRNGRL